MQGGVGWGRGGVGGAGATLAGTPEVVTPSLGSVSASQGVTSTVHDILYLYEVRAKPTINQKWGCRKL